MISLYYYGLFHFNTPEYALESSHAAQSEEGILRILVPPKFTTNRSQYNRYARFYILSLEAAFLTFVFLPGILATAAGIAGLPATAAAVAATAKRSLVYRGLFGFMGLAGILPSLPLAKRFDGWILEKFHERGMIPQNIRLTADRLFGAPFKVTKDVARQVSEDFPERDTIRVAQRKAKGSLEQHLLRTEWLRKQQEAVFADPKFDRPKLRLDRDFKDVFRISRSLQREVKIYLEDQERLVPEDKANIDAFLEEIARDDSTGGKREFANLKQRRTVLKDKCDSLYYRMCLITAMMVFSVETRAEDVNATLRSIGFSIAAKRRPKRDWKAIFERLRDIIKRLLKIDWSTIFYITVILFVITLTSDSYDAVEFFFSHVSAQRVPELARRVSVFVNSGVEAALYGAIIFIAVHLKERLSRPGRVQNADKDAVAIAWCCYIVALPAVYIVEYHFRYKLSLSPLLYATPYGIVGYFIARYIDLSLAGGAISWRLTLWHVLCQGVVGIISSAYVIVSFWHRPLMCAVFFAQQLLESALIALVISQMFQRLYSRTMAPDRDAQAYNSMPVDTRADLYIESVPIRDEVGEEVLSSYSPLGA